MAKTVLCIATPDSQPVRTCASPVVRAVTPRGAFVNRYIVAVTATVILTLDACPPRAANKGVMGITARGTRTIPVTEDTAAGLTMGDGVLVAARQVHPPAVSGPTTAVEIVRSIRSIAVRHV